MARHRRKNTLQAGRSVYPLNAGGAATYFWCEEAGRIAGGGTTEGRHPTARTSG